MPKTLTQLPEMPSGAIFNAERGFLSIVVPLARDNLILNPLLKNNSTGWSTFNSSVVSGFVGGGYHGGFAASMQPSAPGVQFGIFYLTSTLTAGTTYVASVKFRRIQPVQRQATYAIAIATTGGVDLAVYRFKATERWQWIWVFWNETSNAARRIYIRRDDLGGQSVGLFDQFFISGLQLESCADGILQPTTYIDGDQQGLLTNQTPPPYRWNGTPHASTSTRLATTAAGGYVVNFDRYFYKALAYAGLGLAGVANIANVGAGTDGSTFQATVAQSRQFAVNGFFDAWSPQELDWRRSQLYSVLGPDGVNPRQPRTLIYQAYDGYDEVGSFGRIVASYQSGLEQNSSAIPRESAPISFTAYLPAIQGGDAGASITAQSSVTNANYILQRAIDGTWSAMGTGGVGATDGVVATAIGPDGSVYVGGDFTSMGGVANTNKIAKWSPITGAWTALGTGIVTGNVVRALAIAPNGDLYVGGFFTDAGGSGADHIAKWNGSAWSVVGSATAINNTVLAIAFNAAGLMYVGGDFTNAGGDANADKLAQWDGAAWSAVGATSISATVSAVTIGLDGTTLYIGGTFLNAGGVADADNIAMWDGATWSALGTGTVGGVSALALDRSGMLYAGGLFTTIGGVTASYIARWNGSGWSPLGGGVNNSVLAIAVLPDGTIAAGGTLTIANGITLPDRMALWNGSAWVALDVDLPGSPQINTIVSGLNTGVLFVGYSTAGTATAAGVTVAANAGTARTYPTFTITGPSAGTGKIFRISNSTTGKLLYLNLTMNAGETVTITASNNGTRVVSSFRGDISNVVLPGSAPDFVLAKGNNNIAFFTTSATVAAIAVWPTVYQSPSDLTE